MIYRRTRYVLLLFIVSGMLLLCHPYVALALPPPMSLDQLFAASDVVAEARVLSVKCLGIMIGTGLRICSARLGLLNIRKGHFRRFDCIDVWWQEIPPAALGRWYVAYEPGEKTSTHLRLVPDGRYYQTTWWNGARRLGPPQRHAPAQINQNVDATLWTRLPFIIAGSLRRRASVAD
jgi:hypothetical protein